MWLGVSTLALVLEICPGSSSLIWRLSPGDQAHGTPRWLGQFLSFMCSPGVFLHAIGKSCLLQVKCSHLQMQMPKMRQTMNTDDCRKNLKEWQENSDKEGAADWVNQDRIWKTSWKVEPGCKPRKETSWKIPRHGAHWGLSVRCQGDAWRAVVASICRQCLEPARKANSLKFRNGERLLGWM